MAVATRSRKIVKKVIWFLTAGTFLWLIFIAPFASILALLSGAVFYSGWAGSLLILPGPFLLLMAVFRSRNRMFRWWVFQYLGICAVCFSGALAGVLLSIFLSSVVAGQIAIVLCVLFCAWGIYSAHRIKVVNIDIASEKIKQPVRLVQISDVHIGSRRPAYLDKVINSVNAQKPDILAITGDLIDEDVPSADLKPLSNLGYPVFYSSGNHERYVNYQKVIDNIAAQGVTVLNDITTSCLGLRISGIEDRQHVAGAVKVLAELKPSELANSTKLDAESATDDPFSLLLYHQPDLWDSAKQHNVDLMLAGHTHKGQVWPFGLIVRTRYRYVAGLFKDGSSHLFVSQGTGTWGPIMRFGTRCEITVIDLKSRPPL